MPHAEGRGELSWTSETPGYSLRVDTLSFLIFLTFLTGLLRSASIFFSCRAAAFHSAARFACSLQRLAGAKLAKDRVLVGVPRLRVAPERLLGAQLAHGRRGGDLFGREALEHRGT